MIKIIILFPALLQKKPFFLHNNFIFENMKNLNIVIEKNNFLDNVSLGFLKINKS